QGAARVQDASTGQAEDHPSHGVEMSEAGLAEEPVFDAASYVDADDWEPVIEDGGFESESLSDIPEAVSETAFESGALAALAPKKPDSSGRVPRLARMTAQEWPTLAASLPLTGLAAELARESEWVGAESD